MTEAEFTEWKRRMEEDILRVRGETERLRQEGEKSSQELRSAMKNLTREWGSYTNTESICLEEEFAAALREAGEIGFIKVKGKVWPGMRAPEEVDGKGYEYDLVGFGEDHLGKEALVAGEIKHRVKSADVVHFAENRLPVVPAAFDTMAKGRRVFGAIGGSYITASAKKKAQEYGLFVLHLKNKQLSVGDTQSVRPLS